MEEFDVVVLGTGAAGLTAAIAAHEGGATVAVFEKADLVGGTTAWSGGQVWIPNNPHMAEVGVADSREKALTYIMSLSRDMLERRLVEAYVDAGPEMVELLEAKTPVQFYAVAGMPDYHPEFPGGSPDGGRTIECPIYPFDELGEWAERVTPSPYFADPHITMSETPLGKAVPEPPSPEEHERRRVRNERGCGQALVGRLLRACLDRGIEPRTSSAGRELIIEDGAVVGVVVDTPDGPVEVRATKGVVLASGGFEWNEELRRAFLRGPMTHPVSIETSTGDGLLMAMKAGAMLANMREAWWIPVGDVPIEENPMGRVLVNGQRTLPHSIMVNRRGRRFTNEAANYNAFGGAFHVEDVSRFEYANLPCWLVFDQNYVDNYGFRVAAGGGGGQVPAWVPRGDTPAELADARRHGRRGARAHDRALERAVRRGPRSRLRPRRQRLRLLVGRPAPQGPPGRHARPARPGAVLRVRDPQRLARHQGRSRGSTPTPGCSTSTAIRSPGCTPPATSWVRRSA